MTKTSAPSPHILVVDNDPLILLGTVYMLREQGFDPESAHSGRQALEKISGGFVPDLLITDYGMPGGNGVELASAIAEYNPGLRVLVVSGHTSIPEPLGKGWRLLTKPFSGEDLHEALDGMVASAS